MPTAVCPTCRRAMRFAERGEFAYFPFCSRRCQDADLEKWLSGQYRISTPISRDADDSAESSTSASD